MEDLYLGKPMKYWLELERLPKKMKYEGLILEIANLRSRVSFYESRIEEMARFVELVEENS